MVYISLRQCLNICMEQSTSQEVCSFSTGQEIPHILQNLEVCYHVYKSPQFVLILSQMNPVHSISRRVCKIMKSGS